MSDNNSECDDARHAGERMSEAEIDYNLMESFPASDPPSWTLGVRPRKTSREEFEGEKPSVVDVDVIRHKRHRSRKARLVLMQPAKIRRPTCRR